MRVSKSLAASTVFLAVLSVTTVTGQTQAGRTNLPGGGGGRAAAPPAAEYRIGAEDVLDVVVFQDADLTSRGVQVRPDGRITLPIVNDLTAVGLTPMQLGAAIRSALMTGDKYKNPEVSVTVREVNSLHFTVSGHVKTPNRYPLRSAITVVDAIVMSGGFDEFAAKDNVLVLRADGTKVPFNFDKFRKEPSTDANFLLKAGDQVIAR